MRLRRAVTAILVLALLSLGAPAGAYSANNGRFAERFGGSAGRTSQGFHPNSNAERWAVSPTGGETWQGPLLLDGSGHVLTFAATGTGASRIIARNLPTGAEAWRTSGVAARVNADCVAVAPDGTIWAQTADGSQLLGLRPGTGTVARTLPAPASDCNSGLQILPGNRLAYTDFCCSDRLHVVDLSSGTARPMPDEMIYDAFLLTSPDGRRGYVTTPTVELLSLDLATGAVRDRIPLPAGLQFGALDSSVVRDDGAIFVVVGGDLGAVMRIDDDGTGDLTPIWRTNTVGPIGPRPSSLLLGGRDQNLVVGWQGSGAADTLLALDADTGALAYRATIPDGASDGVAAAAMLADADGNVILPQVSDRATPDGGVLYDVLDPAGVPIGRSPVDLGEGTAGMVLAEDGTLVVRTRREGAPALVAITPDVTGSVNIAPQVSPANVGAGIASLRVTGTVVADARELLLRRGSTTHRAAATAVATQNPLERRGRFDLRGADIGDWDLLVVGGDGLTTDTGLTVRVDVPDPKAGLRVDVQQPRSVRNGRTEPVLVTVRNLANIDAHIVPVVVTVVLGAEDGRQLTGLFDVQRADGSLRPAELRQRSVDDRTLAVGLPVVPAGGRVTLPFLLDVPTEAPSEGTVEITAAAAACIQPGDADNSLAQVGTDPCFDQAVAWSAGDALDPVANGAAQCLAAEIVDARSPLVQDGVVVIEGTPEIRDLGDLARSCYVRAEEEAGGVTHPVLTVFKAEAFLSRLVTGYFRCSLATPGGSDSGLIVTGSTVTHDAMDGPVGVGNLGYVTGRHPLDYRIHVENVPAATSAARVVEVTTTLDADVDPATVELGSFGWGGVVVDPPPQRDAYTTLIAPEGADHRVVVTFTRNAATLTWRFETLSLAEDAPPPDEGVGFLPPDTPSLEGDGFVTFRVAPLPGVADGTEIQATADVTVDNNASTATNIWSNTLDLTSPVTTIAQPTMPSPSNTVTLDWSSHDATSGIAHYLVDRLDDDAPPHAVDASSSDFLGVRGETFTVRVQAVDGAGNVEKDPPTVTVTVAADALDRLAGSTRIGTAIEISRRVFDQSGIAVLARADTYPDSLTGATLARDLRAPLLLTDPLGVDSAVQAELHRLGVRNLVALGGTAAISPAVVGTLEASGFIVERVSGADRFATAAAVSAVLPAGEHAFVTMGRDPDPTRGWPDALLVAPWAARAHQPLLLVEGHTLPGATREALVSRGVTRVTVVGGDDDVSPMVVDEIMAMGISVTRLDAADRYTLGEAVSRAAIADGAGSPEDTWLATGLVFADALSAGAAVAATGGTMLLVDGHDPLGSPTVLDTLASRRDGIGVMRLVGGPAAITQAVEFAVRGTLSD